MQRKRGDGGRFFSPKTKEELAMLGQVRSGVSRNIFKGKKKNKKNCCCIFIAFSFCPQTKLMRIVFCLPMLQTDASQVAADETVAQMIRVQ